MGKSPWVIVTSVIFWRSFSSIYQNLDLPQIEAIVVEIEREKEAGELIFALIVSFAASKPKSRGGEEAQQTGCNSCGPSSNVSTSPRRVWTVVAFVFSMNLILLRSSRTRPLRWWNTFYWGRVGYSQESKECEDCRWSYRTNRKQNERYTDSIAWPAEEGERVMMQTENKSFRNSYTRMRM